MTLYLNNKRILLGVTGSIAAYKSADLVRRLREVGAEVRVVMTQNAERFITPLTMQAVSGYPVHDELFDVQAEAAMGHIELARWADAVLIAPASADFMARLAKGIADDLLTTICLATKAPIVLAPAMNQGMWKNMATQANLHSLEEKGIRVLGTGEGSQACGDQGPGRMLEPLIILEKLSSIFGTRALSGVRAVITAGPTQEAIDPVRFISNASSGKMGYALAEALHEAGATVTLISGPVSIEKPAHIDCISVRSAEEMQKEVMQRMTNCDIFLAVAAVADYRSQTIAEQKMQKSASPLQITLVPNPDIVTEVGKLPKKPFIVGFAAETDNVIEKAQAKRRQKNMDVIIANQVGKDIGIGSDENAVTLISENEKINLPQTTKRKLARQLVAILADQFKQRKQ